MNNSQNTQKQLSQEQIDSLNALYAKMKDPAVILEFYTHNDKLGWIHYNGQPTNVDIGVVFSEEYQYRIKPQPKMKTVIQVKEAQLPLPKEWRVSSIYNEVILSLPCHSSGDAETWQRFLALMMNNTTQVEDK